MATLGEVMVNVGADLNEFNRGMTESNKKIKQLAKEFKNRGDDISNLFEKMSAESSNNIKDITNSIEPAKKSLFDFGKIVGKTSNESTKQFTDIRDAVIATRVELSKIGSATQSGKDAIKLMQELNEATHAAQMAALGFDKTGTIKLSVDEAQKELEKFQETIAKTEQELEQLAATTGDFGSYSAGMETIQKSLKEVEKAQKATAAGGMKYISTLEKMGVHTSNTANEMAVSMERYKDRFIRANDMMLARATESESVIENLQRMNVRGLDQQFLKIGTALENMAKRGNVANVALMELGKGASMYDLHKQIQLINRGITRMQSVSLVAAIAVVALTAALWKAASGPKPGDVMKEQADLMAKYTESLNQRAKEIYDFAGLFDKVSIKTKVSGKQLTQNLQQQVNVMKMWAKDLKTLAKRGVDEGLIQELQKMGPQAAGEIHALTKMSDKELNKYVALWKEKHAIARKQATDELAKMKEETDKKIKELQDSLKPLGIATEEFKQTWADALEPFIDLWGRVAAKFVDVGTKVGEFIQWLNSINPMITKIGGMFIYLTTVMTLLLAPLAIGISRAGSFAVAFNVMWAAIRPFVIGLLSVIGTAMLVSAAIIGVVYSINKMWKSSENLRNTVTGVWNSIKQAAETAFAPLKIKLEELQTAFVKMIETITGGKIGDFWKNLGDTIATVIDTVSLVLLPIFTAAFEIAASIIGGVIDILIFAFQKITEWWTQNKGTIMPIVQTIWNFIVQAFTAVGEFITSMIPIIKETISAGFEFIKTVIEFVMTYIAPIVVGAFQAIMTIVNFVMPFIVSLVQTAWEHIKSAFTSAINIIKNIFQLFTNILKGNWSDAWQNIKNILSNALTLAWDLINLYFIGKIFGIFRSFATGAWNIIKGAWTRITTGISNVTKSIWTNITKWISNVKTSISKGFDTVKGLITKPIDAAKTTVLGIIDKIKSGFAKMKIKFPKIKLPHIKTGTKTFLGVTIPTFSLEWYAKGGIVDGASMIGVGEAGSEAILPIENRRRMKPYANMVAGLLSSYLDKDNRDRGDGDINIIIQSAAIREEADITKIAKQLKRLIDKEQRRGGAFVY